MVVQVAAAQTEVLAVLAAVLVAQAPLQEVRHQRVMLVVIPRAMLGLAVAVLVRAVAQRHQATAALVVMVQHLLYPALQ